MRYALWLPAHVPCELLERMGTAHRLLSLAKAELVNVMSASASFRRGPLLAEVDHLHELVEEAGRHFVAATVEPQHAATPQATSAHATRPLCHRLLTAGPCLQHAHSQHKEYHEWQHGECGKSRNAANATMREARLGRRGQDLKIRIRRSRSSTSANAGDQRIYLIPPCPKLPPQRLANLTNSRMGAARAHSTCSMPLRRCQNRPLAF